MEWKDRGEIKLPKQKKSNNGLSSLLPTGGGISGALAGGAAGAAIGSVVPVIGTGIGGLLGAVLGGAGGSAAGKFGQNIAEENEDLGEGVLGEALLGGATSLPITGGFKLLKGAGSLAKAGVTGGSKAAGKKLLQEAGQLATPKMANKSQALIADELAGVAVPGTGNLKGVTQLLKMNNLLETGRKANLSNVMGKKALATKEIEKVNAANAGNRSSIFGKNVVGISQRNATRDAQSTAKAAADEAKEFNRLAKENIENINKKNMNQGIPLSTNGNITGGVLVGKGKPASFASEGIEYKDIPEIPQLNSRYASSVQSPKLESVNIPVNAAQENITRLSAGAPEAIAPVTSKGGFLSRSARATDAKVSGLGVGTNLNGKTITPKRSEELYNFARSNNVNPGTPLQQARQAEDLLSKTVRSLDDTLENINRGVTKQEIDSLNKIALKKVSSDAAVIGSSKTLGKFADKISAAKDLKSLEAIRREADDLAYTARGAKKTSAAAQARAVRETIDDFVSGISKDYKAIKGDYSNAKDLVELSSKNAKTGGGIDIFGNKIGEQTVPGNISKVTGFLGRSGNKTPKFVDSTARTLENGTKGAGILGTVARQSLLGQRPTLSDQVPAEATDELGQPLPEGYTSGFGLESLPEGYKNSLGLEQPQEAEQVAQQQSPFSKDNIQGLILQDLQTTGGKNIANFLKLYEAFGNDSSKTTPDLSVSQQTRAAAAQNALVDIPLLEESMASGKLGAAKAIPGAGTPLGRRILGTEDLDSALFNIADNILRARSGAAAPEAEVKRFVDTFLPGALDSEEAKRQKLDRVVRELYGYVSPTAASEGADVETIKEMFNDRT